MTALRKVALVTGASSGIVRATALHLAQQGWRVFGASVEKIAGAVSFLARPDASYVTGMTLNIYGGFGTSRRVSSISLAHKETASAAEKK